MEKNPIVKYCYVDYEPCVLLQIGAFLFVKLIIVETDK